MQSGWPSRMKKSAVIVTIIHSDTDSVCNPIFKHPPTNGTKHDQTLYPRNIVILFFFCILLLVFCPYPFESTCMLAHSTPILIALPKRSALWRRVCGTRRPNHLSGSWLFVDMTVAALEPFRFRSEVSPSVHVFAAWKLKCFISRFLDLDATKWMKCLLY